MVTYKQWLLYDFAEGKTLASGVSLVEKRCLSLIMRYNKACILVKNERRREAKSCRRDRLHGAVCIITLKSVGTPAKCSYICNSLSHVNSSLKLPDTSCSEIMGTRLLSLFLFSGWTADFFLFLKDVK